MRHLTLEQRMMEIEAGSQSADFPTSNHHYTDCKFVIQAQCSGYGWMDTKNKANTPEGARKSLSELLADNDAWMPGDYERKARIAKNKA